MMTSVNACWYGPLRCRRVNSGVSGRAPKGVQGVCDHFTAVAGLLSPRGLVPTPARAILLDQFGPKNIYDDVSQCVLVWSTEVS